MVWNWAERLAQHSDPGSCRTGPAHRHLPHRRAPRLRAARVAQTGCASTAASTRSAIDAVGNVVGVYHGSDPDAPRLLTGSHYDTVRNGGKYDGRLGILVPMACVRELHRAGPAPALRLEVVGFAEEEGQRYKATFLGSGALVGQFDEAWLDQADADGVTMRQAMQHAGLCHARRHRRSSARPGSRYLGFVEVHIEQGPVLNEIDLPLGVVTSINGSVRYLGEIAGTASHAGTTPMDRRRDAAAAVAELVLYVEQRAAAQPQLVGTGRHAGGAQRIDQRGARPLPLQPGPARNHERGARRADARRAGRAGVDLRAARRALQASRRPCAPTPRRARPPGSAGGNARWTPPACRCTGCPAAPATTR